MVAKDKTTKNIKKPKKPKKTKKTTRRRQPQKAGVIQKVKINIGGSGAEGVAGIPQYKINEATRNMLRPSGQAPPPPQEVIIRHLQPQQAPLTSAFSQNNMSQQPQQPLGSDNGTYGQQQSSFTQPSAEQMASFAAQQRATQNVLFDDPSISIKPLDSSVDDDISVLSDGSRSGFLDDVTSSTSSMSVMSDFSRPSNIPRTSQSQKTYNVQQPLEEADNEQESISSSVDTKTSEINKYLKLLKEYERQEQLESDRKRDAEAQLNAEFAAGAQVGEMQRAAVESSPQEPDEPEELIRVKPKEKHHQNITIDDPKDPLKQIKVAKLDVLKSFARSKNDDEIGKLLVEGGGGLPSGIGKLLMRKYPNLNLPKTQTGTVKMNAETYNILAGEV